MAKDKKSHEEFKVVPTVEAPEELPHADEKQEKPVDKKTGPENQEQPSGLRKFAKFKK